jgi:hypothetical protein
LLLHKYSLNIELKQMSLNIPRKYAMTNAAMWLDLDHMTRGEHIQEI